ncbi:MAG: hypothetical protein GDYSWBUE_001804 [Candidatus Fervidibacterota bacterium]
MLLMLVSLFGLCIRLAIAWQPYDWLIRTGSFGDDACYYAAIAHNIAKGNGATTDGIHTTNGFQPLWAFMLVPIYALGASKESAINIAMTILATFSALTGLVLFLLAKRLWDERVALWVSFFWMTSPTVLRQSLNGMETGLYVFMLSLASLLIIWHSSRARQTAFEIVAIGLVLGLVVLSRVDGMPFALAAMLSCAINPATCGYAGGNVSTAQPFKCARPSFIDSPLIRLSVILFVFLVTLSPWLIYSLVNTGKLIPESGSAVRYLSLAYIGAIDEGVTWRVLRHSLAQTASTLLRAQQWSFIKSRIACIVGEQMMAILTITLLSLALPTLFWLARVGCFRVAVCKLRVMLKLWFWIVHAIALLLAYSLYQFGWWFFPRYFFAVVPLGIIAGSLLVEALRLSLEGLSRNSRLKPLPKLFVVAVVLMQLAQLSIGWHYMQARMFGAFEEYLNVAMWLREHIPQDARIGMFQSGTASYLSERTVINLDGVVNGEALKAMLNGQMVNYVASQGISYIADWDELIQLLLVGRSPREELSKWKLVRLRKGEMSVYKLVRSMDSK